MCVSKNRVGGDLVEAMQEVWRRKTHTPHSNRVGPNKTCRANKNIRKHKGRVHTFVRWSNSGWSGGSARLDFFGAGGRFCFCPTGNKGKNNFQICLAPKRSRRNLTRSNTSEGGVPRFSRTRKTREHNIASARFTVHCRDLGQSVGF